MGRINSEMRELARHIMACFGRDTEAARLAELVLAAPMAEPQAAEVADLSEPAQPQRREYVPAGSSVATTSSAPIGGFHGADGSFLLVESISRVEGTDRMPHRLRLGRTGGGYADYERVGLRDEKAQAVADAEIEQALDKWVLDCMLDAAKICHGKVDRADMAKRSALLAMIARRVAEARAAGRTEALRDVRNRMLSLLHGDESTLVKGHRVLAEIDAIQARSSAEAAT